MVSRIRAMLKRWLLASRERRAGKIAKDAGARAQELYDRGKTGGMY